MNQLERLQLLEKLYEEKKYGKMIRTAFAADGAFSEWFYGGCAYVNTVQSLIGKEVLAEDPAEKITDWHFRTAAQYLYLEVCEKKNREILYHELVD
jgi:hypothetical protein